MRAFLLACLALLVIGACGYVGLGALQQSTGSYYATDGARINPRWTWRSVFQLTKNAPKGQTAMDVDVASGSMVEECDTRSAWQWIFVDFGSPDGEPEQCSVSQ